MTCSLKAQGVLDLSIFSWVFQHPVITGVDIENLVWLIDFCPFFPGCLTSSFDIILLLLGCSLLRFYAYRKKFKPKNLEFSE
jgi:hypothetical protein